jgi:hypothetical protein
MNLTAHTTRAWAGGRDRKGSSRSEYYRDYDEPPRGEFRERSGSVYEERDPRAEKVNAALSIPMYLC